MRRSIRRSGGPLRRCRLQHRAEHVRTANEAAEVTHQTFISTYEQIASIPANATFRNWLFATAIKTSLAERRPRRVNTPRSAVLPKLLRRKWPDLTDSFVESGKLAEPLREALERMDDRVRAAFVLRDLAELPTRETAAILQTSRREILLRVHRARLMLMSVLDWCFQSLQRDMGGLHA